MSKPKNNTCLPNALPFVNGKDKSASNQISWQLCPYLSLSTFLINVTAPNKNFTFVNSVPRSYGHKFLSEAIYKFTNAPWWKVLWHY